MTKTLLPIAVFMAMLTAALGLGQSAAAETSGNGPFWPQSATQAAPTDEARVQLVHWDRKKPGHRHTQQAPKRKHPGWHKAPRYGWYDSHRKPPRYGWYDSHRKPPRYGWYGNHRKPPYYGAHKPRHYGKVWRNGGYGAHHRHGKHFYAPWGDHFQKRR